MIGSVGGNPFATQTQAYSALKPGVVEQENPNDKLKPASEDEDSSTLNKAAPSSSDLNTSGVMKADSAERSYDSGGITSRGDQRGMLLDVSA